MKEIDVMALVLLEVYDAPCFSAFPVLVVYHHDTRWCSLDDACPTGKHAQTTSFQPDAVRLLGVKPGVYSIRGYQFIYAPDTHLCSRNRLPSVGTLAQSTGIPQTRHCALFFRHWLNHPPGGANDCSCRSASPLMDLFFVDAFPGLSRVLCPCVDDLRERGDRKPLAHLVPADCQWCSTLSAVIALTTPACSYLSLSHYLREYLPGNLLCCHDETSGHPGRSCRRVGESAPDHF